MTKGSCHRKVTEGYKKERDLSRDKPTLLKRRYYSGESQCGLLAPLEQIYIPPPLIAVPLPLDKGGVALNRARAKAPLTKGSCHRKVTEGYKKERDLSRDKPTLLKRRYYSDESQCGLLAPLEQIYILPPLIAVPLPLDKGGVALNRARQRLP